MNTTDFDIIPPPFHLFCTILSAASDNARPLHNCGLPTERDHTFSLVLSGTASFHFAVDYLFSQLHIENPVPKLLAYYSLKSTTESPCRLITQLSYYLAYIIGKAASFVNFLRK